MTNYILLEGLSLYVFLVLIAFLIIACIVSLFAAIIADCKVYYLKEQIYEEREKNISLNRENMRYKLKYGALDPGKEQ